MTVESQESSQESPNAGVKGWFTNQCKMFLKEPIAYSLDKFIQAIFVGLGISILTMAVKVLVDAITASLPL